MNLDKILAMVKEERQRQDALKAQGRFKYTCADAEMLNSEKLAVLVEEVGEAARAILNKGNLVTDKGKDDLQCELIQIAAVAVAWVEGLHKPDVW